MLVRRSPEEEIEQRFVDFVYLPLIEEGARTGVIAHGTDVTQGVVARHAIQGLLDESELARRSADEARADAEEASRTQSAFLPR
jgi:hypothetical protein